MLRFFRKIISRYILTFKIIVIVTRWGLWRLLYQRRYLPFMLYYPLSLLVSRKARGFNNGQRLVHCFIHLGGSFIKFGQILSVRPDIIGNELADSLRQLQDNLPPFSSKIVKNIIEKNLNKPLDEIFMTFDETPIAAASIAQIHHAVLHNGDEVAVKILRPNIHKIFARDIDLLHTLCRYLEFFIKRSRLFRFREIIETYQSWIKNELNLRLELISCKELHHHLINENHIIIPQTYPHYSNQNLLVMEWIEGIKIDEKQKLLDAGHQPEAIIKNAVELFFLQVFRDGFFHADIHPGNLFIQQDGSLAAVDFGITGRLDKQTRFFLADILIGFIHGDYNLVAKVHFDMGYVPATQSQKDFASALRVIGEPMFRSDVKTISFAEILIEMIALARQFDMKPQLNLLLLHKTMIQAEGIGRILVPGKNIWLLAQPLIEEWLILNRNPLQTLKNLGQEFLPLIIKLPAILQQINTNSEPQMPIPTNSLGKTKNKIWYLPIGIIIGFLGSMVLFSPFLLT